MDHKHKPCCPHLPFASLNAGVLIQLQQSREAGGVRLRAALAYFQLWSCSPLLAVGAGALILLSDSELKNKCICTYGALAFQAYFITAV